MRILMVAPEPFFEPRGTPISVYQRLEALSSLGHEVDLLTYHVGKDVNIPGVQIHRIPRVPFIREVRIGPSWPKLFLDVLLVFKALTLLLVKRYDVIHSHEEAAFFSVVLAALFHMRHLYDMHSSLPRQLENFKFAAWRPVIRLFEALERWVLNTCDAVITIGADLDAHVRTINPRVNCIVVENLAMHASRKPIDPSAVSQLSSALALDSKHPIVYTGSFERYQGIDLLLASASIVRQHFSDPLFILVGGKPRQVEQWTREAQKHQLDDCVLFVGIVPPEEALLYLEIAEVLVSPRTNGTSAPLKIYSYLHVGKPLVATRLPAHLRVLNDDIALLVEPTPEAFAQGVLKLLRDPRLRGDLGRRAQQFAGETYSFAGYLAKMDDIYRTLLPTAETPEIAEPSLGQ